MTIPNIKGNDIKGLTVGFSVCNFNIPPSPLTCQRITLDSKADCCRIYPKSSERAEGYQA